MGDHSKATPEHIRNVLKSYVDLMTAGDYEAIVALYAVDATVEDPIGSPPHCGHAAIREMYRNAAGKVQLQLDGRVRVVNHTAAAPMIGRPTGMEGLVVEIVDIMTFNDEGLITSMRAYWSPETIRPED